MIVVCPNPDCKARYDLEPEQIPSSKKGFKCAQCEGFVPVDLEAVLKAQNDLLNGGQQGTPKSLIIILALALLMIIGGAGFFYYQLQLINQGSLVVEGSAQPIQYISSDRMAELQEKIRQSRAQPPVTPPTNP